MTIRGRVRDGVVIPDNEGTLPEGAEVRIEVISGHEESQAKQRRKGGMWNGRVRIVDDFDKLPDDIAEAFGMQLP